MSDPDPTPQRVPAIRVIMMPRDTNAWGTIFGGVLLSYIDQAGAVEAMKVSPHKVVTVGMKEVSFHQPVLVGDLVSFYTRLLHVGRTSIAVHVEVIVERSDGAGGSPIKVTEAEVTYVAVDNRGRPIPASPGAPPLGVRTPGPPA